MMVKDDITYGEIETATALIWENEDIAIRGSGIEKNKEYMKGYYDFHELNAGH